MQFDLHKGYVIPKVAGPSFVDFEYRDATYRIFGEFPHLGTGEIIRQRDVLDSHIRLHSEFATSLVPIEYTASELETEVPAIVENMLEASSAVGVGPMAAVAGAIAERAALAMQNAGASEVIVNNGGDLYICADRTIIVGLFAGARNTQKDSAGKLNADLALRISPDMLPCSVCSSSSSMGHSTSFGAADLATVVAASGALADAAATGLCNKVLSVSSGAAAVEEIAAVPNVSGALAVIEGSVVFAGEGIDLVRHSDPDVLAKVAAHPDSDFQG